jgi:hypothetical protein
MLLCAGRSGRANLLTPRNMRAPAASSSSAAVPAASVYHRVHETVIQTVLGSSPLSLVAFNLHDGRAEPFAVDQVRTALDSALVVAAEKDNAQMELYNTDTARASIDDVMRQLASLVTNASDTIHMSLYLLGRMHGAFLNDGTPHNRATNLVNGVAQQMVESAEGGNIKSAFRQILRHIKEYGSPAFAVINDEEAAQAAPEKSVEKYWTRVFNDLNHKAVANFSLWNRFAILGRNDFSAMPPASRASMYALVARGDADVQKYIHQHSCHARDPPPPPDGAIAASEARAAAASAAAASKQSQRKKKGADSNIAQGMADVPQPVDANQPVFELDKVMHRQ